MSYINQNRFSEYLALWNLYECGHRNQLFLLEELRAKFPFDNKPLRKNTWSISEAILVYYGLNSNEIFSILDSFALGPLLHAIDSEYIGNLLENHIGHKISPARDCILVSAFVSFLKEKKVQVPFHLRPATDKSNKGIEIEDIDEMDTTSTKKRIRKESYRKEIMRQTAALYWYNEKKEGREYTSPTDLARKEDMKKLVALVNKIGEIKQIQGDEYSNSGIDLEWFSDLYPGEKKPGPKSKN